MLTFFKSCLQAPFGNKNLVLDHAANIIFFHNFLLLPWVFTLWMINVSIGTGNQVHISRKIVKTMM